MRGNKTRKQIPIRIGLRTIKSAIAVVIALWVVDQYGASGSKLIFALIGALSAMEPTFTKSVRSCLTQICGVIFGAVFGVLMSRLPIDSIWVIGLGVIIIITAYNALQLTLSPALPCIILVTICTTADIVPAEYALGRIWDTTIGLAIGLVINMLFFPYDNSRQIRESIRSLDRDLMEFLEDYFDGDGDLPDAEKMNRRIEEIETQLSVFAGQRLPYWKRHMRELSRLQRCDELAKALVTELEVLSHLERPGRLSGETRQRLANCGAKVADQPPPKEPDEIDIVTNYHVGRVLTIRRKLRQTMAEKK